MTTRIEEYHDLFWAALERKTAADNAYGAAQAELQKRFKAVLRAKNGCIGTPTHNRYDAATTARNIARAAYDAASREYDRLGDLYFGRVKP